MPTATARYINIQKIEFGQVSDALKLKLQKYCPAEHAAAGLAPEDLVWGSASEEFARRLVTEAQWAFTQLNWHRVDLTKQQIRAIRRNLMTRLKDLRDDLRALPHDFTRLLTPDVEPKVCADEAARLCSSLEAMETSIDSLPPGKRIMEKQSIVAVELTVRVLRVLSRYGIPATATANTSFESCSVAVKVLKDIGAAIGLQKDPGTWRGNIIRAKKLSPDLW